MKLCLGNLPTTNIRLLINFKYCIDSYWKRNIFIKINSAYCNVPKKKQHCMPYRLMAFSLLQVSIFLSRVVPSHWMPSSLMSSFTAFNQFFHSHPLFSSLLLSSTVPTVLFSSGIWYTCSRHLTFYDLAFYTIMFLLLWIHSFYHI